MVAPIDVVPPRLEQYEDSLISLSGRPAIADEGKQLLQVDERASHSTKSMA